MKIWVTADLHFNHDNILKYCDRPFANVSEMNEGLIERWNANIKLDDVVWVLGDFAYPPKTVHHISYDELAARLNGIKHLVVGNHDKESMRTTGNEAGPKAKDHWMWEESYDYYELKFGKSRFVLCHYPLETWNRAHRGSFMLHGHCHASLKRVIPHRIDVGVDTHPNCEPYSLEAIRDTLAAQTDYKAQDHHGD